jgi:hypothetical protein
MNWSSESQRPLLEVALVSHISSPGSQSFQQHNKGPHDNVRMGSGGQTHCIKKHSVPSSGRKERTFPLLQSNQISCVSIRSGLRDDAGRWDHTYNAFKAIQSFNGTLPYQQLPFQFVRSQMRTPPTLRFTRGFAALRGVPARKKAAVAATRKAYIIDIVCW